MDSSVFISTHVPQLLARAGPFSCHLARTSSVTVLIKSSQRRTLWSDRLLPLSWRRVRRWKRENDIFILRSWSTWLCSEESDFESNRHPYSNNYIIQITLFLELPIHWRLWECPELFQGFWQVDTGSALQVIWSEPCQCSHPAQLRVPRLHRRRIGSLLTPQSILWCPTDPSMLLARLWEFWKHWEAPGELLILS